MKVPLSMDSSTRAVPLCVDCDGTLIRTDLLHEGLLLLVKQAPLALLLLPFWLLRGKAYFKQRVAERVTFRWESLPYRQRVLELMQAARSEERPVLLATASPRPGPTASPRTSAASPRWSPPRTGTTCGARPRRRG